MVSVSTHSNTESAVSEDGKGKYGLIISRAALRSAAQVFNLPTSLRIAPRLRALALALVFVASAAAAAADDRAAALLFSKDQGGLAESERVEIFKFLGLSVAPDGKSFIDQVCGQPASAEVRFSDMNSDKVKEVLVTYGNTCLSGHAGSAVVLFIKDSSGSYRPNLGFPASSADPLPSTSKGYPDLLIGGTRLLLPGLALERHRVLLPSKRTARTGRVRPPSELTCSPSLHVAGG